MRHAERDLTTKASVHLPHLVLPTFKPHPKKPKELKFSSPPSNENVKHFHILPKKYQANIWQVLLMATFGEYIKKKREEKEMTQDKLSKLLDIPYTDVSHIERGRKKFKFDKLPDLANVLEVDLQELKDLYGANIMLEQMKKYECSDKVFEVAEQEIRYHRSKNAKQGNLKF